MLSEANKFLWSVELLYYIREIFKILTNSQTHKNVFNRSLIEYRFSIVDTIGKIAQNGDLIIEK